MSEKYFATGHCLCGKVNYTISSPPVRMGQCHCDDCRRLSGTGHSSNAFFKKDDVQIDGETQGFDSISDTGAVMTRYFCPECGSRLFGTSNANTNIISVTAGTLDDSSWFKPDRIVYNKRKPVWDFMDESIPAFEEMPPSSSGK
jgi:hypothetical protein